MKMESARVVIDLDDYDMSENQIVPISGDYRLERRWKRFELSNKRVKRSHHGSGTRSSTKRRGNMASLIVQESHTLEDEVDEDYKLFLATYNPEDIDVISDGKVDGSDNDINIGYDSTHYDHQYRMFLEEERFHNDLELETERMRGSKNRVETKSRGDKGIDLVRKQTSGPIKSQPNLEAKRRLSKKRPHEDVSGEPKNKCHTESKGSKQRDETGSQAYKGSVSVRKRTGDPMKSQQNLEAKRGLSKKRTYEDVSGVAKNIYHTEMMKGSKQSSESGNKRTDSVRKQTSRTMKSQLNLEAKRGLSKKRPYEGVSVVPENICHSTELDVVDEDYQIFLNSCMDDHIPSELIGNISSVMQNSQVPDHVLSEVDEDYLQYLNSVRIVDDEVACLPERNTSKTDMPERNTLETDIPEKNISETDISEKNISETDMPEGNTSEVDMPEGNTSEADMPEGNTLNTDIPERNISNTVNVDGDSNSSEPDLILLEPDQIHENTPFVSSKTYDPSWFETETNPKGNWQLSAYDHPQFRTRLMNDLQRPYDQDEYERLLLEVHQKRRTERHVETRQGVVKSYCTTSVNKSYLELYPDLAEAIAEFKKTEKVLFLLRGFIFWLQNSSMLYACIGWEVKLRE
ncbi:unnamed protein product [Sphenostylis stenocarpa]|uniref:Uncharacterized protein n=1 Tax=Sphenostylis stenocarpa TaxID=92480 RepID=A0AA86TDP6_9FABA|nr:unnamed protein product [Sphenostylis stenocarpa]